MSKFIANKASSSPLMIITVNNEMSYSCSPYWRLNSHPSSCSSDSRLRFRRIILLLCFTMATNTRFVPSTSLSFFLPLSSLVNHIPAETRLVYAQHDAASSATAIATSFDGIVCLLMRIEMRVSRFRRSVDHPVRCLFMHMCTSLVEVLRYPSTPAEELSRRTRALGN
jgi:hypothetical protein